MQVLHRVPLLGLALALALAAGTAAAQDAPPSSLRQQMSAAEFRAAGLDKLSPAELAALEQWLQRRHGAQAAAPADATPAVVPATPAATVAPAAAAAAAVDAAELERIREQAREEGRREVREQVRGFSDFGSSEPITSNLVGEFRGFGKGNQYTLANGQVWEQTEEARLEGVRLRDPAVTIKPGLLNNVWYMRIKGYSTTAKVRRIR